MDVNPYQSPTPVEEQSRRTSPGTHAKRPLSRWEILVLGGMAGILYHSCAGFLLGMGFGIMSGMVAEMSDFYVAAGRVTSLSLLGASGGVLSGAIVGSLVAACYVVWPRSLRHVASVASHLLHWFVGAWAIMNFCASIIAVWEFRIPHLSSDSLFYLVWILAWISGSIIGWLVARLVNRRILQALVPHVPAGPQEPLRQ